MLCRSEAVGAGFHRFLAELAQGLLDRFQIFPVVAVHRGHSLGGTALFAERVGFKLTQNLDLLIVLKAVVLKDRHDLPFDMRHGKSSRLVEPAEWWAYAQPTAWRHGSRL